MQRLWKVRANEATIRRNDSPPFLSGLPPRKMSDPESDLKRLERCIPQMVNVIDHQAQVYELIISLLHARRQTAEELAAQRRLDVLIRLFHAVGVSNISLLKLSSEIGLQVRDCFSIARSILETGVNICYILAKGEPEADRAYRHALQKSYRDRDRKTKFRRLAMHIKLSEQPNPSDVTELDRALSEFTDRKGREITEWGGLLFRDRVRFVCEERGDEASYFLINATHGIYRHASEIIHGTYFGALFCHGRTGYISSGADLATALGWNLYNILFCVFMLNEGVFRMFIRASNMKGLKTRTDDICREFLAIDWPWSNESRPS